MKRIICGIWVLLMGLAVMTAVGQEPTSFITFPKAKQEQAGITLAEARPGQLTAQVELHGEVKLNADRMVQIVPRLEGVARTVHKSLGDTVETGEPLLVMESRELADAQAAYLACRGRTELYTAAFRREENLYNKGISPAQDYLQAKQDLTEAKIAQSTAVQKLLALGITKERIAQLPNMPEDQLTHYEITAPFSGTVIKRDVVAGQVLAPDAPVFVIADLSTVWIDLNVYQKDLPLVRPGLRIAFAEPGLPEAEIDYVGPVLGEESRTALARVIMPNPEGAWRPGLFVTAHVAADTQQATVLIPVDAIQSIDNKPCVFVAKEGGFEVRPITISNRTQAQAAVASGLSEGEVYAATETFILKAELGKAEAAEE